MYRIRAPESCDLVRLHLAAASPAGSQCTALHSTAPHRTALLPSADHKRTRLVAAAAAWPQAEYAEYFYNPQVPQALARMQL